MSRSEEFRAESPSPYRVEYRDDDPAEHAVLAYHEDSPGDVGELYWRRDTGEIANVAVNHEHHRRGVATMMLNHARAVAARNGWQTPTRSSHLTDDGRAWAEAVGG